MFKFLANPLKTTKVEWGHVKLGEEGSERNWGGTKYSQERTGVAGFALAAGEIIRAADHNHPSGYNQPSKNDHNVAKDVLEKYPNAILRTYTSNPPTYSDPYNGTPAPREIRPIEITIQRKKWWELWE